MPYQLPLLEQDRSGGADCELETASSRSISLHQDEGSGLAWIDRGVVSRRAHPRDRCQRSSRTQTRLSRRDEVGAELELRQDDVAFGTEFGLGGCLDADLSVRNLAILCESGELVHVVQEHLRDALIRQRRAVRVFECCAEGIYNGRGAHGRG